MEEIGKIVSCYNPRREKIVISALLNDVKSVEAYYKRNYEYYEKLRGLEDLKRPYNPFKSRIDNMLESTYKKQ